MSESAQRPEVQNYFHTHTLTPSKLQEHLTRWSLLDP